jgi:hypothetical protein
MMRSVLIVVVGLTLGFCLSHFTLPRKGEGRAYDCSIAEISPDYPVEVKEGCRKLRMENVK